MNKQTLTIAFFLLFGNTISRAEDSTAVKTYYFLVHQAALSVAKGDLPKSIMQYDSAFSLVKYPFADDIRNALYTQSISAHPNREKFISLLEALQKRGVCVHQEYKSNELFAQYLSQVPESSCKSVVNPAARKIIEHAIAEDQRPRDSSYNTYKEVYHPSMMQEIRRVDAINFKTVDSIFKLAERSNVPVESYIGFKAFNSCTAILLHNAGRGATNKFTLDKFSKKGLIDSRVVSTQWDAFLDRGFVKPTSSATKQAKCDKGEYGTSMLLLTFSGVLIKVPSDDCLKRINEMRGKIYLQDVVEEAKIRAYAFFNFKKGFSYPGLNILSIPDEVFKELEADFRQKYKIIKYANKEDFDINRGY